VTRFGIELIECEVLIAQMQAAFTAFTGSMTGILEFRF